MNEMICIVCPRGCHMTVGDGPEYPVEGNACPRGALYAREERISPQRSVSATCAAVLQEADAGILPRRVPVRTTGRIPKERVLELVSALNAMQLPLPVRAGDIVIDNWSETGVSVIVTRDIG